MHYFLWYELGPDYLARRGEFRPEHLKLAWEAVGRGELALGGAVGEPVDTALLLFQGDSPDAAERFARADPYVKNGLVARWRVRPWTTVVGPGAATPVRP
ncbi:MAG TPA: YciI-like protein [Anaeromyxobacteraceae bacterium]|nr:YciI-like protein [Anaeromyxobacteraceae bacterium]